MRPKDLKSIFTWATRAPLLKDKILYVPEYYFDHHKFTMPSWEAIFDNTQGVSIEYCSGNGDWVVDKARAYPEKNWVAIERQFERVRKIFSKRANYGVNNLLIVCGEALTFTRYYLPEASVEEVYINFPDPWPKHRHAKHRLIQKAFIEQLARVLVPEGKMTCVTDDESYCKAVVELMLSHTEWQHLSPEPYFRTDVEGYGYSFFEALWKNLGKPIFHIEFLNIAAQVTCLNSLSR